MKLKHKLGGVALVALTGLALAIPNTTKATTTNSKDGAGHIEFTYNSDSPIVVTDPTGTTTQTTITNIDPVNPGEFGMIAVTPLEFGSQDVLTAKTQRDYYAGLFVANPDSDNTDQDVIDAGTQKFETANFVSFQDLRSSKNHDYELSATLTEQFTDATTSRVLNGSELVYSNVNVAKLSNDASYEVPGNVTASQKLTLNNKVVFINNTDPSIADNTKPSVPTGQTGYGQFNLIFGKANPATDAEKAEQSIKLTIPDKTAITSGDYKAVITWTLESTM